ncbi:hypothetical protein PybrP1_011895 [[Pythium] brassicae (nom. inval.)]|nr:hypothetical protein PybrP1_011895 [[Pythium] brassicae (nom. inval.)]
MSAVDNVDARIARLQRTLDEKRAELRAYYTRQRYNPALGVDEAIATGRSVASLDVKVVGGRNMLFNSGFLAGKTTYVRAWLEPHDATPNSARLCTRKQPVQYSPCWQESLVFEEVARVSVVLMVEVMQEERIGSDLQVGSLQLPLTLLQDQRVMERWHVLLKDDQASASELLLSCRFNRSRNQLKELGNFVKRQHQLSPQSLYASERYIPRNPLHGKEVDLQASMQRSASSRFSAVATFPLQPAAARKREHVEFARTHPCDAAVDRRVKKSALGARSKLHKTPSAMQSFEQWLFKDPENMTPN